MYYEKSDIQKQVFAETLKKISSSEKKRNRDRKLIMVLDPDMPYHDRSLVAQCEYPILSGALHSESCLDMVMAHHNALGARGPHLYVYVVMPSLGLLSDHMIGELLPHAVRKNVLKADHLQAFAHRQALKRLVKSLHKHLKRTAAAEPKYLAVEMQMWLQLLATAAADLDAFLAAVQRDDKSVKDAKTDDKTAKDDSDVSSQDGESIKYYRSYLIIIYH
jgi:hypothetical protein